MAVRHHGLALLPREGLAVGSLRRRRAFELPLPGRNPGHKTYFAFRRGGRPGDTIPIRAERPGHKPYFHREAAETSGDTIPIRAAGECESGHVPRNLAAWVQSWNPSLV